MYDFDVILSFITAFALTYLVIPPTIRVALEKNLLDEPDERRSHTVRTPRLGGVAIFAGAIFSIMLWTPFSQYGGDLQYVLCTFILIFLIGVKDDIDGISPSKKLVIEVIAASILFFKSGIRITSLYGILGIGQLPVWLSAALTVFTIIVIINALNLIDGINGLSGSLTVIITVTLGFWFHLTKRSDLAIMAMSAAGATSAFLRYNYTPARIFMGDTGSLLLGLICSILAIEFIELNAKLGPENSFRLNAAPGVAISILILPLFDTLRVFLTRVAKGRHPMQPDRNHIHHLLLDSGLNHMQATVVLASVNVFFILMAYMMQRRTSDTLFIILMLLVVASLLVGGLYYSLHRKTRN